MRTTAILKFVPIGVLMAVAIGTGICGCGSTAATSPNEGNPVPAITNLSPTSTVAGGVGFTLTVSGTNFVSGSVVRWNSSDRPTTFVSSSQLTAQISASDIATVGTAVVTVFTPAPGGGTSNASNFAINNPTNPIPTIAALLPAVIGVGGPGFTLTVSGSNFVSSSVVRWNGSDRPTTFVDSREIDAQIPASDIAATGTAPVTVFNPAPGGGTSNSLTANIITGVGPVSVVVAPDPTGKFGKFAYVANSASNNVSMYTINPTTGALAFIGAIAAGTSPSSITVDPSGKFLYVANTSSDNISMYTLDVVTGALTSTGTIVAGVKPAAVTVDPSGKFAYVANTSSDNISTYTIDAVNGALRSTGMVAAGTNPASVTVDPSGKFAYVANPVSNSVSMYTIASASGSLTSTGTVAAGMNPNSVSVHPSGNFAYAANCGDFLTSASGGVSMYTIASTTGVLTSIGSAGEGTGVCSWRVTVHPSGKFVYVIDIGDLNGSRTGVYLYSVDVTSGKLALVGIADAGGLCPMSIALDPSGKFAYVADNCSNSILMYTIDPVTGSLTLRGTIGT